ncbi:hypothetical protein A5652_00260 [Mycobacterium sp. 1165178.9]|nr:hypothetical protein A5652_00260 [Mycobacterium sp. 1165178.9]
MKLRDDKLSQLQDVLRGPVFIAETPGYDRELVVFNAAVRHQPAAVRWTICGRKVVRIYRQT